MTLDILAKVTRYRHIEVPDEDGVVIAVARVKQGSYDADNMEVNYSHPLNWS